MSTKVIKFACLAPRCLACIANAACHRHILSLLGLFSRKLPTALALLAAETPNQKSVLGTSWNHGQKFHIASPCFRMFINVSDVSACFSYVHIPLAPLVGPLESALASLRPSSAAAVRECRRKTLDPPAGLVHPQVLSANWEQVVATWVAGCTYNSLQTEVAQSIKVHVSCEDFKQIS